VSPTGRGTEVVCEHVRKMFEGGRIRALEDITMRVGAGEFVALTGRSGCGKSTLLNLIGALDRPDSGTITVGGQSLAEIHDLAAYRARTVGFVFQFHYLIPTLSALWNVMIPMIGGELSARERELRARELLADVGLADRADDRPGVMSGGERQRVAIARALANHPPLLLADEPTGALDTATGAEVLALLGRVREQYGMSILMVTNDDEVSHTADRVVRMLDGRILPATPAEVPRSD
jgi:putative ABC transport system ATP-binding protein